MIQLLYKNQLQSVSMSRLSETFQIIVSSKQHQQLIDQVGLLTNQKENLREKIQEQNKKLQMYVEKNEELLQYPKKVYILSKTVLRQSRIILDLQQLCKKLKNQQKQKGEKQEIQNQKSNRLHEEIQDLNKVLNSNNLKISQLLSHNDFLKSQLKQSQTHISDLQNQVTLRELQLQQIKKKVQIIQIDNKRKDDFILNEKNQLDEREKKIVERQDNIKKSQTLNEERLQEKLSQLQNQYTKRIQSLKEYISQQQQIERLNSQVQKLSISNESQIKKIKTLQKKLNDANSKIDYLKQYYQDEDNIQNLLLDIYIKSLDKYRIRLIEVSEKNITCKIIDKKNQLIKVLQRRIKQQLHLL